MWPNVTVESRVESGIRFGTLLQTDMFDSCTSRRCVLAAQENRNSFRSDMGFGMQAPTAVCRPRGSFCMRSPATACYFSVICSTLLTAFCLANCMSPRRNAMHTSLLRFSEPGTFTSGPKSSPNLTARISFTGPHVKLSGIQITLSVFYRIVDMMAQVCPKCSFLPL